MGQAVGCSLDDLPCCTKNTSTTGDIVKARPVGYESQDDLAKGEVPVWSGALKEATAEEPFSQGGGKQNPSKDELRVAEQIIDGVQGQETYEDGSSYEGQLADGRRHGHGTWTSVAEQYCGQWVHDQRHGKGKQTWQDGRAYEGNFKQGKFHGKGRMEWHTPKGLMLYDGEYFEDLKHGHGKYIWPDGRKYEGGWKEGLRCGQATYTNAQGQSRTGIWKDDKVERWLDDAPPSAVPH